MVGNSVGRVHHEAFGIVTERSGTVMTVLLSNGTWPYFSLVGIERSWSSELQDEYGRNNRIRMLGCAYQIFVAEMLFWGYSYGLCVWDTVVCSPKLGMSLWRKQLWWLWNSKAFLTCVTNKIFFPLQHPWVRISHCQIETGKVVSPLYFLGFKMSIFWSK